MFIEKIYNLSKKDLFLIPRSITGKGLRDTLKIFKKIFPKLKIKKIKSGKKVFDWVVPPEWNIKDAYILDKNKNKIIDFKKNNLHLIGYSMPVNRIVNKKDLVSRLYSLPKQPSAIPYITSYYKKYWGFCISEKEKKKFLKKYKKNDKFHVVIKSNFDSSGFLNYGELILKGISKQEILISTYICHPSMANNELSGPIVSLSLIKYFSKIKNLKKTLRFIFIPETIGSITYLNKNLEHLKKFVIGGFNLSCVGDEGPFSCIHSKYQDTQSDFAAIETFKKYKIKYKKYSFLRRGSDERQYNSPGIDLPIVTICRSKFGEYPEYHTSLDNFDLVTLKGVKQSFEIIKSMVYNLISKQIPKNIFLCEPNLGKRSLYPTLSKVNKNHFSKNILNFLQYSDGKNNLNQISKMIKLSKTKTLNIFKILRKKKLIKC